LFVSLAEFGTALGLVVAGGAGWIVAGQLLHVAELVERVRLAGTVSKVASLLECVLVARRGRVVAG
jgi:hypothetical protein